MTIRDIYTCKSFIKILAGISILFNLVYFPLAYGDSFDDQVVRAFFTTSLKNGKPKDEVLILENNVNKIFFYSEIRNMKGRSITHSWEHRGEKLYEKKFEVNKDSISLVSSYKLGQARTGEWMVLVKNDQGVPIKAVMFKYVKKGSFAGKGIVPIR